jgi:hypothetical protein
VAALSLFLPGCQTAGWQSAGTAPSKAVLQAAGPEAIHPEWIPFAAGLDFFAGRVKTPRLEFWALRVDLSRPELRIVVNGAQAEANPPGHIPSTTVSGFVKRYGCIAGLNTNPFSPVSGRVGEDRRIDGIAVSDGYAAALPNPAFDALVFYRDGPRAAIVRQADVDAEALRRIEHAAGGFHIVLQQGELSERVSGSGKNQPRHPRSAAGVSADGNVLYLLAVDGRRPGSVGATEAELGLILRQLGAFWGLNFDGGGSTALVLRDARGRVKAVNIPIHRQIPGWERGVAICLGIALAD